MQPLSIGEVCDILGLRPHILRYWEHEIPVLSPSKDGFGRREYNERELQQLYRIKYLVYTKKYTVQGVARKLLQEASGRAADRKGRLHAVRHSILTAAYRSRAVTARLTKLGVPRAALDNRLVGENTRAHLSAAATHTAQRELRRYPQTLWSDLGTVVQAPITQPEYTRRVRVISLVPGAAAEADNDDGRVRLCAHYSRLGETAFTCGEHLVFTPVPSVRVDPQSEYPPLMPLTAVRKLPLLELIAERLQAASYHSGRQLTWVITVPEPHLPAVRAFIRAKRCFGFRKGGLVVVPQQSFPLVHPDGSAVVNPDGNIPSYWSGLAGSFRILCSAAFAQFCARRGVSRVLVVPSDNPLATFPAFSLLGLHIAAGNSISIEVVSQRGVRFRASGAAVLQLRDFTNSFTDLPLDRFPIPVTALGPSIASSDNADNDGTHGIRLGLRWMRLMQGISGAAAIEIEPRAGYAALTGRSHVAAVSQALSAYDRSLLRFAGVEQITEPVEVSPLFALDPETAARRIASPAGSLGRGS